MNGTTAHKALTVIARGGYPVHNGMKWKFQRIGRRGMMKLANAALVEFLDTRCFVVQDRGNAPVPCMKEFGHLGPHGWEE